VVETVTATSTSVPSNAHAASVEWCSLATSCAAEHADDRAAARAARSAIMAASDRAMLHSLTAPATGKIPTAPTTSEMGVPAHATTVLIANPTHKMPARACGWKTASVGR